MAVDTPGTVSQILWHFTGGPLWDSVLKKQGKVLKPAGDAFAALLGILTARELRVGQYHEIVKVQVPKRRRWDAETRKAVVETNVMVELESSPVNCLADIPIIHLGYHAQRYGRFAVGFHRASAIKHGFSPLLYSLHDAAFLRSIYQGFAALDDAEVDVDSIKYTASDVEDEIGNATCEHGHELDSDAADSVDSIETDADRIQSSLDGAKKSFEQLLAFVKTFNESEFRTIYCEREWRSISTFKFTDADIAMIVAPRNKGGRLFFDELIAQSEGALVLPRKIPIVPWEDLLEH